MPPSILSNADLASLMETRRRVDQSAHRHQGAARVARATGIELSHVAGGAGHCVRRPRSAATSSSSSTAVARTTRRFPIPRPASSCRLGARTRGRPWTSNTACTSFMYGLSTRHCADSHRRRRQSAASCIGVELILPQFMDWTNRGVAVLFGDGAAAVVLQATDREEGLIGEKLGCDAGRPRNSARARNGSLRARTTTSCSANTRGISTARKSSSARARDGQRVAGRACEDRVTRWPTSASSSRHQANLRIIESVAKRVGAPMERVYLTVQRYGNMSSATIPVSLVEALEDNRVEPGGLILMPGVRRRTRVELASRALGQALRRRSASRRSSFRRPGRLRSSACASSSRSSSRRTVPTPRLAAARLAEDSWPTSR